MEATKPTYTGKLISIKNDAKTIKGQELNILTGVQYFAPHTQSGIANVCAYASDGCAMSCLFTAGRGKFSSVRQARINRTIFLQRNRSEYWQKLIKEIQALIRKAQRENLTPAIRLNGTSDIVWERTPVTIDGVKIANNIMELFATVQFYDYTKYPYAKRALLPSNYDLTFSRSETNQFDVLDNLSKNRRVAVVFDTKKGQQLPATYLDYPIIDGDLTDVRFYDDAPVIVGLRAKGDAKADSLGFVVKTRSIFYSH